MEMKKYKRVKEVSWQELGGKGILISMQNAMAHELNTTALDIWKFLDEEKSLEEIENHFCEEYQIDFDTVRPDIIACLEQMQAQSLIQVHE